jgi:hypothetical protein
MGRGKELVAVLGDKTLVAENFNFPKGVYKLKISGV